MRTFRLMLLCCLLLLASAARGQVRLTGLVKDGEGKPLPGVVVKVYEEGARDFMAYGLTDRDGRYAISVESKAARLRIACALLGYKEASLAVPNRTAAHDFRLAEAPIDIREVTVKAPPVNTLGDTLIYNVDTLRGASDRTIEDVIRRIPGVSIDEAGGIQYKGEDINRFYIEDLDMLGGRYTLATQNIRPEDVLSVDVYENHQPKKVLKDVSFSKQAALNLRLKKRGMMRPVGDATAGAGWGDGATWTGRLYALMVATGHQHLLMAEGNNFATHYTSGRSLLGGGDGGAAAGFFADDPFGTAAVPAMRYRFNRSAMTSVNNIFRLSPDLTLTVTADYAADLDNYDHTRQTDYLLDGGHHLVVDEQAASALKRQQAGLQLRWEKNAATCYLTDELNVRGSTVRDLFRLDGSAAVRQRRATDAVSVSNHLEWIGRKGRRVSHLLSDVELSTTPRSYINATDPAADTLRVRQDVEGLALRATVTTSLGRVVGRNDLLSVVVGMVAGYDRLTSRQASYAPAAPGRNDGYYVRTTVAPTYSLMRGNVSLKASAAVVMHDLRYRDRVSGRAASYHRPFVSPRLDFIWRWYDFCSFSLDASYGRTPGSFTDLVTNAMYSTYRDVQTMGNGELSLTDRFTLAPRLNASLPLRGLHFLLEGSYMLTHNDRMASSTVAGGVTGSAFARASNRLHLMNGAFEVTKNCFDIYLYMKLRAEVSALRTHLLRQGVRMGLRNRTFALSGRMEGGMFAGRMTARLGASWRRSVQATDGAGASSAHFDNVNATLRISLFPWKKLECYATGIFAATETEPARFRTDFYLDGGIRLALRRMELELALRNLTGRHVYVSRTSVLTDVYTYTYRLRPAEGLLTLKYKF